MASVLEPQLALDLYATQPAVRRYNDGIEDDLTFGEWVLSLPLTPDSPTTVAEHLARQKERA